MVVIVPYTHTVTLSEIPENVFVPMLVTDPGILIIVKLEQLWKAKSPMVVTESGMVIEVKLEQDWKSPEERIVKLTLIGKLIDVKLEQL